MDLHNNFIGREAGKLGIPIDESKLWTLPSTGTEYIIVTKSLFMKNKLFYSILLFYYMFRFHIKNKAEITIMNLSNQKVEMIEVVFPKQKFIFRDLDINSEFKMDVPFASEGSIIVEAKLTSGKILISDGPYITSFDINFIYNIHSDRISFDYR